MMRYGDVEEENTPLAQLALYPDSSAMPLNYLFANSQPQSKPRFIIHRYLLGTIHQAEHSVQFTFGDAYPMVSYTNDELMVAAPG